MTMSASELQAFPLDYFYLQRETKPALQKINARNILSRDYTTATCAKH